MRFTKNAMQLIGRVGHVMAGRTPRDQARAVLRVYTDEKVRDPTTGKLGDATELHTVVLFGPAAEAAPTRFPVGSTVLVEGPIRTEFDRSKPGKAREVKVIYARECEALTVPVRHEAARTA